jgi:CRP-like cAMP-binding protein
VIVNQELVKMVGSNTLFKGVSRDFLKSFIKPKNYFGIKEGTIIYSKGDDSTDLYLIVEGEVKIKFCEKNKVEHRFITDFFGEEEIINKNKRLSHAVANHDSILYSIKSEELENLIRQHSKISENLNNKNNESNNLDEFSAQLENEDLSEFISNDTQIKTDLNFNENFEAEENLDNPIDDNLDDTAGKQDTEGELPN